MQNTLQKPSQKNKINKLPAFFPDYRSQKNQNLKALTFLLFVLVVLRLSTFLNISTHYLGGADRDAGLYIWLSEIAFPSVLNNFRQGTWFNTNAFYPYSLSLAWSDNYIFPSLLYNLFKKINLSPALIYNIIILSAQLLQGYCTYKLSFFLSGKALAACMSGLVFMCLSYFSAQLGHPQMQWVFFLPLSIYLSLLYLSKTKIYYGVALAFCLVGAFLSSVYIAIYALYTLCFSALMLLILKPNKKVFINILKLSLIVFLSSLPFIFFALPYFEVQSTFGKRHLYEAAAFALNASNYLHASQFNFVYGKLLGSPDEGTAVFCGFLIWIVLPTLFFKISNCNNLRYHKLFISLNTLILFVLSYYERFEFAQLLLSWSLLLAWLIFLFKLGKNERVLGSNFLTNRNIVAICIGLILFFFILTLGPLAFKDDGLLPISFYSLAYHFFPGFSGLRASSRFVICVYLALSVLFSFYLPLAKYLKPKNLGFLILFMGLIFFENYQALVPLEQLSAEPEIVKELKKVASNNDAVIFLPWTTAGTKSGGVQSWGDYALHNVRYMNYLTNSKINLVNGYSGQRSYYVNTLPHKLRNFPDAESLNALREISNLHYLIVLNSFIKDPSEFNKQLAEFSEIKIHLQANGDYLLGFEPKNVVQNKDDLLLRVPTLPKDAYLDLEIKATDGAEELLVFLQPYQMEKEALRIKLQGDDWEQLSFKIPTTIDNVRPRLLRFEVKPTGKIIIGDRNFYAKLP